MCTLQGEGVGQAPCVLGQQCDFSDAFSLAQFSTPTCSKCTKKDSTSSFLVEPSCVTVVGPVDNTIYLYSQSHFCSQDLIEELRGT